MSERFFHDDFACNLNTDYNQNYPDPVIAKNCQYRDQLQTVQRQEGNYEDISSVYFRNWLQLTNLIVGSAFLGMALYRQK
jgi:hypothetical protein